MKTKKSQSFKNSSSNNTEVVRSMPSASTLQLRDNREFSISISRIPQMKMNGNQGLQLKAISGILNSNSPIQKQGLEEDEPLQGKFENTQREEMHEGELLQGKSETVEKQKNNTGLPDKLKSGIENLSGYAMDDVKVDYNSPKPATLQAHAYAQGTEIHIASGQEKHLPHEAWHVVQQKQGRVKPTIRLQNNVNVNDDAGLEKEADVMGGKAMKFVQYKTDTLQFQKSMKNIEETHQYKSSGRPNATKTSQSIVVQRVEGFKKGTSVQINAGEWFGEIVEENADSDTYLIKVGGTKKEKLVPRKNVTIHPIISAMYIRYPKVPKGEEDPRRRINVMIDIFNANLPSRKSRGKIDLGLYHEIQTAINLVHTHRVTHGKQISRGLTEVEKQKGVNGTDQFITTPTKGRSYREIDMAFEEEGRTSIVEAKNRTSTDNHQVDVNSGLAKKIGGKVIYAIPENKRGQKKAIKEKHELNEMAPPLEILDVSSEKFAELYFEGWITGLAHLPPLEAIMDESFNPDFGDVHELEY
jgi:hypothetical protein